MILQRSGASPQILPVVYFNNLTNNGNPNVVNNVAGTPAFLTYGRGQARAFSVRLRLLGRK